LSCDTNNAVACLQQSEHRRARAWAVFGAVLAFTFMVGITAYGQLGPFAEWQPMEVIASRNY
jgi:hypothetical protein